MSKPPPAPGPPFWASFAVKVFAVFVAGVALIVVFREVMIPVLKGDVDRVQQEHHKRAEPAPPGP